MMDERGENTMTGRTPAWRVAHAAVSALVLSWVLGISPASAARDRTPPPTPTNLRVTGMTPYSVSLAWTPSTDNSGSFTY
jgi:hypothetical protein